MLLKQFEQSFDKNREVANVFLAIANTKNKKNNIDEIRNDSTQNTALTRPTILLLDYLKARASDQFKFDSKFYKDDDHFSVFEAAVKDGLKLLVTQN